MPSEGITAALIVGSAVALGSGAISGTIWWGQCNRTVSLDTSLGRNEDKLKTAICELQTEVQSLKDSKLK